MMMNPIEKAREVADASDLLGISAHAGELEIRKAWKRRAFEMHPDRGMGTNDELVEINRAYELLRSRRLSRPIDVGQASNADAAPIRERATAAKPPRPSLRTRDIAISRDDAAECEARLVDAPTIDATDHVPHTIQRTGRSVTYIVSSALEAGSNRIAVPTGFLVDTRKVAPVVVTFVTATMGALSYRLPEDTRARLFPGAASVTIRFGEPEA